METSRARILWTAQCAAVPSIREKFGLQAALDYLISEKLLSFAERAVLEPDCARELPIFVAEIRQLSTSVEIRDHLAVLVLSANADPAAAAPCDDEDGVSGISSQDHAAACERLTVIRDLLEADQLGTS